MTSKFSFIHKLQKNDVLNLIENLSRDEINKIILSLDKGTLMLICKNSFTKSQLQEILYNSDISTKNIIDYLYTKDAEQPREKTDNKRTHIK